MAFSGFHRQGQQPWREQMTAMRDQTERLESQKEQVPTVQYLPQGIPSAVHINVISEITPNDYKSACMAWAMKAAAAHEYPNAQLAGGVKWTTHSRARNVTKRDNAHLTVRLWDGDFHADNHDGNPTLQTIHIYVKDAGDSGRPRPWSRQIPTNGSFNFQKRMVLDRNIKYKERLETPKERRIREETELKDQIERRNREIDHRIRELRRAMQALRRENERSAGHRDDDRDHDDNGGNQGGFRIKGTAGRGMRIRGTARSDR